MATILKTKEILPDTNSFTGRQRIRKSFGRIAEVVSMPNLIEVQRQSYEAFLQMATPVANRSVTGLQEVSNPFSRSKILQNVPFLISYPTNLKNRNTTLKNANNAA